MHALPLLLVAAFTTTPSPRHAALSTGGAARAEARKEAAPRGPENLLAGPARCVLRYLDAVRLAGPMAPQVRRGRRPVPDEGRYAAAKGLTAPRALAEVERWAARGEDHPLAPWREAARSRVLESFQLLAARRAPRGAAVVTVKERFWLADPDGPLERSISEYLVARVDGRWRIVDRRRGGTFDDAAVAEGYAGFFDELRPPASPPVAPVPGPGPGTERAGGG